MSGPGDDTRRRLLRAAGEIFADRGFEAATVREICSRAGANLAAVNYHFGDKERLYIETVRHAHSSGHHAGENETPPDWPPDTPAAKKLRDFIQQMLVHVTDDSQEAWQGKLIMREMFTPTAACAAVVEADIRPRADLLNRIVDELVPSETPQVDRHLIAFSIVGQCLFFNARNRFARLLVGEEEYGTYDVGRLADHIAQFTLAALIHRSEPTYESSSEVPPS